MSRAFRIPITLGRKEVSNDPSSGQGGRAEEPQSLHLGERGSTGLQERDILGPSAAFVQIGERCDIKCSYCFYTTEHLRRSRSIPDNKYLVTLSDALTQLGIKSCILTGGDPLAAIVRDRTLIFLQLVTERGMSAIVNTSAAGVPPGYLHRLVALGLKRFDISIDSHSQEVHNAQRGDHAGAVAAIELLTSLGAQVSTTTVVTELNCRDLDQTMAFLEGLGVQDRRVQMGFIPKTEEGSEPLSQASNPLLVAPRGDEWYSDYAEYAWALHRGAEYRSRLPSCQMAKHVLVIGADGSVRPCFHRPDVNLGQIGIDSPEAILRRLRAHPIFTSQLPECVGPHCTSLFDSPNAWRTRNES